MNMSSNIKIRGKVRFTKEMMISLLGLPEEVEILTINYNADREILEVIIKSDNQVLDYTFPMREGGEIPEAFYGDMNQTILASHYRIYEKMRDFLFGIEEGEGIAPDEEDIKEVNKDEKLEK